MKINGVEGDHATANSASPQLSESRLCDAPDVLAALPGDAPAPDSSPAIDVSQLINLDDGYLSARIYNDQAIYDLELELHLQPFVRSSFATKASSPNRATFSPPTWPKTRSSSSANAMARLARS